MERRCFNEVHPDSRVLVYSSAKLRDLVYGATQGHHELSGKSDENKSF